MKNKHENNTYRLQKRPVRTFVGLSKQKSHVQMKLDKVDAMTERRWFYSIEKLQTWPIMILS